MNTIQRNGLIRAAIVFALVAGIISLIFYMLNRAGVSFFGQPILVLIGAGWSAFWVWKKTEYGHY